jgi:hypothetical protein
MKHQSSRALYAYWNECRGDALAPKRSDIDAGAIRTALSDSFLLARAPHDAFFRLAGTRVCALFCRELKGASFASLWPLADRRDVANLIAIVAEEANGIIAGVRAEIDNELTADLELLLLPLIHQGCLGGRLIGVLAPLAVPEWIGRLRIRALSLQTHRHLGTENGLAGVMAAPAGRLRKRFIVYEGGRA